MKQMSFFDLIYNYLVSVDNDCVKKEQKDEIFTSIQRFFHKQKGSRLYEYINLSRDSLLERDIIKEIGISMLLDYENEMGKSIFYEDMIESKNYDIFKRHIYYPTLKLI